MGQPILGALDAKAIIECGDLTNVPMLPRFIGGVANPPLFAMSMRASPRRPLSRGKT